MAQTATVQIEMPEMGESVTEGIVLEWHVAEGDFVNEGDTVVEVSTDKVDAEVPAPTDGVITKLIASVDDEVPVGAPLAEMEPGRDRDRRGFQSRADGSSSRGGACGRCSGSVPGPPAPLRRGRGEPPGGTNGSRYRCAGYPRCSASMLRRRASTLAVRGRVGPGGEGD